MARRVRSSTDTPESRLEFETLISDLSSRFISVSSKALDREIEGALRGVCEPLGVDLAVLWQWSRGTPGVIRPTHFFPARFASAFRESLHQEQYPWTVGEMLAGRIIRVSSLDQLPAAAAIDRESLRSAGIKSNLTLPLTVGGASPVGALAFNALRAQCDWPDVLVGRLQLVAEVFANALTRKLTDEALRESEERLALVVDSAEAGLWTLDYDSGVFWATPKARAIFGYSPDEEITMERFREWVHPEDWDPVRRAIERSASAGEPVDVDYRVAPPGAGRGKWIRSRGRPVRGPDGRVSRLTGVSADVTERKDAERASREHLEFETLIAGLSSRFVLLSPAEVDASIEDALRCVCVPLKIDLAVLWQWSAAAPDVLTPTHSYSVQGGLQPGALHQEQFPWYLQQMRAGRPCVSASLDDLPAEAAVDRETCRLVGVKSNLTIPLAVGGEPVGVLGFNTLHEERDWPDELVKRLELVAQLFTNALARRRAEETLRASRHRLEAGTDLARLAFYEVNFANRTVFVDDRFRDICGIPPEASEGLAVVEFWIEHLHPEDRQRVLEQRAQLHDGRLERLSVEYRYLHPTHGEKWLEHEARVTRRDATQRTTATFGVVRDITQHKRVEEELRSLSRRLIRAHEEQRTRLARELHDDVTQRLARLAIDAGRLETGADDASTAETMRSLREGLVGLSEDVHSLAYRLHPSVLEDLGLAEALKAECERFSRQESIAADIKLPALPTSVPPDTALCLFRVAQEALRNVARHAKARSIEVSMRDLDGGLQLAVRDDGVGFDPALQPEGRTLGLASMRERVHLANGELDIESAPGRGTTIVAWVPLETEPS